MYYLNLHFIGGVDRILKDVTQEELHRFIDKVTKISETDFIVFNEPEKGTGRALNLANLLYWDYRPQAEGE